MPLSPLLLKKYSNSIFIETGSGEGAAIESAIRAEFNKIISIEWNAGRYGYCQRRFNEDKRVHLIHGDAPVELYKAMKDVKEPCTIWLDAIEEGMPSALLREITVIREHPVKGHTILMRAGDIYGRNAFGEVSFVSLLRELAKFQGYSCRLECDDILVASPNTETHTEANEFDLIYQQGGWDFLGSGPGSTPEFTKTFRRILQELLSKHNIKSVFDLGCGDWQWQSLMVWTGIHYSGWDISKHVIQNNKKRYQEANIKFYLRSAFQELFWPKADLLLCKDVVHHLNEEEVASLIEQSKNYPFCVWVVDLDDEGLIHKWPGDRKVPSDWTELLDFDRSVENYRYGTKKAYLQINR